MQFLAEAKRQKNSETNAGISTQLNETLTVHAETTHESIVLRREELNRLKAKDEKEKDKVLI